MLVDLRLKNTATFWNTEMQPLRTVLQSVSVGEAEACEMQLLIVLTLAAAAAAMPAYDTEGGMLALYYANAVKCDPDRVKDWRCGPACERAGPLHDVTMVYNDSYRVRGFAGYDPVRDRVVLSFRATSNAINWIENLDFQLVNYTTHPQCGAGCKVHKGFYETYSFMALTLMPAVKAMLLAHPGAGLMVTGHSLGAAQAQLALVDVLMTDDAEGAGRRAVTAINFGCPRVGNPAFADWGEAMINASPAVAMYRIVHADDPVPMVPFTSMGFQHFPREFIWYDRTLAAPGWTYCNATGVQAAVSDTAPACGASSFFQANNTAHLYYLGVHMDCHLQ